MNVKGGGSGVASVERDSAGQAVGEPEVPAACDPGRDAHSPDICGMSNRKSHHSEQTKADLIVRLNRTEGQVRGIRGLIEKDAYCDDVLHQIAAVQAALNSVGKKLLAAHMRSCVVERIQDGDLDVVDELLKTMNTLLK
jgi:DNA-binding FrmR family transcriptional regulator